MLPLAWRAGTRGLLMRFFFFDCCVYCSRFPFPFIFKDSTMPASLGTERCHGGDDGLCLAGCESIRCAGSTAAERCLKGERCWQPGWCPRGASDRGWRRGARCNPGGTCACGRCLPCAPGGLDNLPWLYGTVWPALRAPVTYTRCLIAGSCGVATEWMALCQLRCHPPLQLFPSLLPPALPSSSSSRRLDVN